MTLSIPYSVFGSGRSAFNKLFVDYVAGNERTSNIVQNFFFGDYRSKEVQQKKLEALSQTAYPRKQLVEILEQQNRALGASIKTLSQIQKFVSSKTVAIVTGQQSEY